MRKLLLTMVVLMTTICVSAQESVAFRYGCISYDQVLKMMPEYSKIDVDMQELKAKFDAEVKASEEEFNAKYETFLAENRNYAPSILRKRQSELEDMMKRNEAFRAESLRLLEQARADMLSKVRATIDAAIAEIATEYSLAFVLNTDSDAVPYLNVAMAYNITGAVIERLKISQ